MNKEKTMTLVEAVAKRMISLMNERNISQYRIIKETCLDKTTIQTILKNKTKDIRLSTIFLIANVFDMSMSEFLDKEFFDKKSIDL